MSVHPFCLTSCVKTFNIMKINLRVFSWGEQFGQFNLDYAYFQPCHLCVQHFITAHTRDSECYKEKGQVWWTALLQPCPFDEIGGGRFKQCDEPNQAT